jgi:hypothetical protein
MLQKCANAYAATLNTYNILDVDGSAGLNERLRDNDMAFTGSIYECCDAALVGEANDLL